MTDVVRHAFGKIPVQTSHSQTEDTPPSDRVRDTIRREQEARVAFRGEMENLASATKEEARRAVAKSQTVDWKLNLLIGLMGSAIVMAITAFAWMFTRQEDQAKQTVSDSGKEARLIVTEELRTAKTELRAELKADRAETIKAVLDEQERRRTNPDLVTARTKPQ